MPRQCQVCSGRYFGSGLCEFHPFCPRQGLRRRNLGMVRGQAIFRARVEFAMAVVILAGVCLKRASGEEFVEVGEWELVEDPEDL